MVTFGRSSAADRRQSPQRPGYTVIHRVTHSRSRSTSASATPQPQSRLSTRTTACVFFNSTCLATLPAGSRHVEEYFSTLVEDLTFTALATFFIDALVTFTLARFGGVPVGIHCIGSVCWLLFVFIVFMQWLMVLLSLIMDVFTFIALRELMSPCLLLPTWSSSFALVDVGGLVILLAHPKSISRFLMLFVSAYMVCRYKEGSAPKKFLRGCSCSGGARCRTRRRRRRSSRRAHAERARARARRPAPPRCQTATCLPFCAREGSFFGAPAAAAAGLQGHRCRPTRWSPAMHRHDAGLLIARAHAARATTSRWATSAARPARECRAPLVFPEFGGEQTKRSDIGAHTSKRRTSDASAWSKPWNGRRSGRFAIECVLLNAQRPADAATAERRLTALHPSTLNRRSLNRTKHDTNNHPMPVDVGGGRDAAAAAAIEYAVSRSHLAPYNRSCSA